MEKKNLQICCKESFPVLVEIAMSLTLFLLSVVFISLSGVMMPGPVTAVTVTEGHRNKNAGALIALGHGAVELPLIAVIYLGLGHYFALSSVKMSLGLMGGLMLIYMGIQMLRVTRKTIGGYHESSYSPLLAGVITTAANPYFFLWWATIGAFLAVQAKSFGLVGLLTFALSHWLCDLAWNFSVSQIVFRFKHFWGQRVQRVIFQVCAAILIAFGGWFIISAFLL